jgi:hypothetical protein
MAATKPKTAAPSLFALAEKQIISLYDAGVLSPAVLHHLLAAYADSGIDWNEKSSLKTVDDHSVQEAVVLITMPGRALRSAQKDFISIVEHLAGPQTQSAPEESQDDEALLQQLGGAKSSKRSTEPKKAAPKGFNPLVGARAVSKN